MVNDKEQLARQQLARFKTPEQIDAIMAERFGATQEPEPAPAPEAPEAPVVEAEAPEPEDAE